MSEAPPPANHRFPTTRWTLVGRLHHQDQAVVRRALDELCAQYHYPLYCHIRRRGFDHADAEDALHDFLAKLLRNDAFHAVAEEKGRLRSFLAVSLQRFLIDWRKRQARGVRLHALDPAELESRYLREVAPGTDDPEILFDRKWAHALIHRTLDTLAAAYLEKGKGPLFDALRPVLLAGGSLRGGELTLPGEADAKDKIGGERGAWRGLCRRRWWGGRHGEGCRRRKSLRRDKFSMSNRARPGKAEVGGGRQVALLSPRPASSPPTKPPTSASTSAPRSSMPSAASTSRSSPGESRR